MPRFIWRLRFGWSARGAAWCQRCDRVLNRTYFGRLKDGDGRTHRRGNIVEPCGPSPEVAAVLDRLNARRMVKW